MAAISLLKLILRMLLIRFALMMTVAADPGSADELTGDARALA